ncbi:LytR/AlgR family response regulator transcription factor [Anaerocolumna jejuensis]|uniref:LytR/AlgR family response regulator transcription factor n=1 Tax=Anaerocolumna jejuensis TaxID=259063 RepID=UPI003F7CC4D9
MPVKIAICDDAAEDIEQLSNALSAYDNSFEITSFTRGERLMDELRDGSFTADLLFLDIYMPGIDGIQTAQEIRGIQKELKIIFLSSSKEHYQQAYEVFAFNYIVKPFDRERLYAVLSRALNELRKESGYRLGIRYKGTVYHRDCRDILYIESRDKLLLFHLADETVLQCYGKLDEILRELPEKFFFRCHQSFLVNLSYVTEVGDAYFRIGQTVISISRKYGKAAKERYYACLFSHMGGGQLQ